MPKLDISKVAPERILGNRHPELAKEWHPTKNGELTPFDVTCSKGDKAWWLCSECGHEWDAKIYSRSRGNGCPECAKKRRAEKKSEVKDPAFSLANRCPDLAKEWHPIKNGNETAHDVTYSSHKKAWWLCSECGYEWDTTINNRSKGTGCPKCAVKRQAKNRAENKNPEHILAKCHPELAKEWHPTKNGDSTPDDVTFGERRMVWWLCSKCGHEWDTTINSRSSGTGCPGCSGRAVTERNSLVINYPHLVEEWHPTKNDSLNLYELSYGIGERAWWLCSKCGHEWDATINNRSNGRGCPKCNSFGSPSRCENAIAYYFNKFTRVETQYRLPNTRMLLDVYLPSLNIGIEYDGAWCHQDIEKDKRKDDKCKELGIALYRVREIGCPELNSSSIIYPVAPDDNYTELQKNIQLLISDLLGKNVDANMERDRNQIEALSLKDFKERSLAIKRPELCKEWHPTKNGGRLPKNFPFKSSSPAWWKCSECSHEWRARICNRSKGTGCPECAKKKQWKTRIKNKCLENSLKLKRPELCKEWHPTKNGDLLPEDVTYMSNKPAWWKCIDCSHEWDASIGDRSQGNGCPECAKKKRWETRRKNQLLKEQASYSSLQSSIQNYNPLLLTLHS